MKLAVIDIGSNSVRLMLWADGKTLYKKISTTRLGEGIALSSRLREDAMGRTVAAIVDFAAEAEGEGAESVFLFATAAVRTAENGAEFCDRVKAACGLDVDVVSGEREARLGLGGVLPDGDGGMIDIGGGSTEVFLRRDGKDWCISLAIGAVSLFDLCGQDRDKLLIRIKEQLRPLEEAPKQVSRVCAVGGTATTVASVRLALREYDAQKISSCVLSREEVEKIADRLLSMTAEERKEVPGMDVRRADIIAGGALLLSELMAVLRLDRVYPSDRDNMEGYLKEKGIV